MQTFVWSELSKSERANILSRPEGLQDQTVTDAVSNILSAVKTEGDQALIRYSSMFDKVENLPLQVDLADCKAAWEALPANAQQALKMAKANIETFHSAQMPSSIEVETMPGVVCRREPRALEKVGLYIPGGSAPLLSTVLMLAVPAKIAEASRRILISPPGPDGKINSGILAAAYLCEVTDVFACGGAQAIAALAYGTQTIPKCDKIFGPGNAFVATAKSLVSQDPGGPAIDLPAGPSEAMVIVDETSNPVFAASDLLSQAEHDPLAQVVCLCTSQSSAENVQAEISAQIETLPRKAIAQAALENARFIVAEQFNDMIDIVNIYAPEHLIILAENPDGFVGQIRNTGSIFLGPWTPESVGDYASGTNHTLPTFGAARAYSGVTLESFFKYISVQKLSKDGFMALAPTVETLAAMEELEAHRRAITLRMKEIDA